VCFNDEEGVYIEGTVEDSYVFVVLAVSLNEVSVYKDERDSPVRLYRSPSGDLRVLLSMVDGFEKSEVKEVCRLDELNVYLVGSVVDLNCIGVWVVDEGNCGF